MGKKGIRYLSLSGVGLHLVQEIAKHRDLHWGQGLNTKHAAITECWPLPMEASPEPWWAQLPGSWGWGGGAAGNAAVGALAAWHIHQVVTGPVLGPEELWRTALGPSGQRR